MKRVLFAVGLGIVAAAAVGSAYSSSPEATRFWSEHRVVQQLITYANFPALLLLNLVGVDTSTSPARVGTAAFVQWLVVGYLLAGIFVRERHASVRSYE